MTLGSALLISSLVGLLVAVALAMASALTGGVRSRQPLPATGKVAAATAGGAAIGSQVALVLAFALLLLALAVRTLAVGHAPWSNLHEVTMSVAAVLLGGYLAAERRLPVRRLAPLVALLAAGLVALALQLPSYVVPLAPALQAPLLLTVHVGAAVAAYAISGLAFVAAVGEIAQLARDDGLPFLPEARVCRLLAHRAVLIAFPVLTAAIALGSVWANLAWRAYWNNDPKELAAAGTWLLYAAYLHVAGRSDRAGRAAPWLLVAGFGAVLVTLLAASLVFPGQHSYSGV
jgi:ABC-type transport system involved in cytochrome c biogenesis permease subunit